MKILVTGGAGFIGSQLVDALIENGHQTVIIDNLSTGKKDFINAKAKFYNIDIQNGGVAEIFQIEKPEVVFHLAAHISVLESIKNPLPDCQSNIEGSINVFESAKNAEVKRIIFSSTGGALYGDAPKEHIPTPETYPAKPVSPYGVTKLTCENYLYYYHVAFGLPYTILRYANVYGPRQNSKGEAGVVAIFIDKILGGQKPVINGDGLQTRDYIFVSDVVKANLLALENSAIGEYNIGTSKETTVNRIFAEIKKYTDTQPEETHGSSVPEQRRSCLDYSLAEKTFSWQPRIALEEGIKLTVEWFKNNLPR